MLESLVFDGDYQVPLEQIRLQAKVGIMSTRSALSNFNRPGWLTFAAVVMFAVGVMQAISGIYFLANSTRIAAVDGGAFGHHTVALGIWELVIAVLSLAGGYSLLAGHTFGRVIGYLWATLVVVESFLLFRSAPWYAFAALLLGVLVIYAISSTSDWTDGTDSGRLA
jgi:hypothetical protein